MACLVFVLVIIWLLVIAILLKKKSQPKGYIILKPKSDIHTKFNDEQLAKYIYWQIKNENKE